VGSSGNLTSFSFYANKNLSTGEGGAIAVFDPVVAERLRSLRQHGLSADAWKRYTHRQTMLTPQIAELGYKMNYTDLQATIGRVQLRRQPELAERRLAIAERYLELLAPLNPPLEFQRNIIDPGHARHLFVVRLPRTSPMPRNAVLTALRRRNIGAAIHYQPLHTIEVYRRLQRTTAGEPNALANTDALADRILTLPISASMTLADVDDVVTHLTDLLTAADAERAAS
jgi:dTDP-4-amino-4,6-dideoxygalactose transaminase